MFILKGGIRNGKLGRDIQVSLALLHLASFPFNVRNKECTFCTENEFQGLHDKMAPNTR